MQQGFEPTQDQVAAAEASFAAKETECQQGGFSFHEGREPMVDELVAILLFHSAMKAQYQRAGFSSEEEFKEWYGKQTLPREGVNHAPLS